MQVYYLHALYVLLNGVSRVQPSVLFPSRSVTDPTCREFSVSPVICVTRKKESCDKSVICLIILLPGSSL